MGPVSPVVEVTPVYSGDTAAVGELAEEMPTEWTDRAGEKDPGAGEVGVVSVRGNSSSLSADGVKRGQTSRQINSQTLSESYMNVYSTRKTQSICTVCTK